MGKIRYQKLLTISIHTLNQKNIQFLIIIFGGKKQLAYSVNKEKYGNYVLLHAEFDNSSFVNDFKQFLNLNSEVLKYLIVKLDEKPTLNKEEKEESK